MLKKLQKKREITPVERTQLAGNEIKQVLDKFHCKIEIGHQLIILPLEEKKF